MRISFYTLTILLTALSANASELPSSCSIVGSVAHTVMTGRQRGVSIDQMLEVLNRSYSDQIQRMPTFKDALEELVVEAYDVPRYENPKNKANAANDFRDRQQVRCMKIK